MKRQLAAILYADVAGYSRLTALDEARTQYKLNTGLNLLTDRITGCGGQKVHEAGDAILAEFASVTDAVSAAMQFQAEMDAANAGIGKDERLEFRIGVNLGEITHDRGDIYGEGVNLAARIQELADPGGICITAAVHEQVQGKIDCGFADLGHRKLKNITHTTRVYALKVSRAPSKSAPGVFFDNIKDADSVTAGGCLCGEVRFEIRGKDMGSSYCHCRMCQRFSGAPVSAGTGFRIADFEVVRGEPRIYTSSAIAERAFCPICGSSLWMRFFPWKWIFVKTLNLDNPADFPPTTHFGIESQMPWHDVHDDLPRLSCEDSPQLVEAWEAAGVKASDPPRNVRINNKK